MQIKLLQDKTTNTYQSKYASIITKKMLEYDMYILKLSQRTIAEKYSIGKGTIQNLQNLYQMQILNMFERRVPDTLTKEQEQVVIGCTIADGHLFRKNINRHAALKIVHTIKAEGYLNYKYELLQDFVRTYPVMGYSKINDKIYPCKSFRTLTHSFFTNLHDLVYQLKTGKYKKKLSMEILNKIDPLGFAIMYQDDGCKHHKSRDFCFECFTFEEQKMFCEWMKTKFNLNASVIQYKGGTGHRTRINSNSLTTFRSIIGDYVLPCMKYKL